MGGTLRITRRAGGGVSQIPREGRERRDGAGDMGQRISGGHSGAGGTSSGEGPAGRAPPARGAACSAWNPAVTGPAGRGFHPGKEAHNQLPPLESWEKGFGNITSSPSIPAPGTARVLIPVESPGIRERRCRSG